MSRLLKGLLAPAFIATLLALPAQPALASGSWVAVTPSAISLDPNHFQFGNWGTLITVADPNRSGTVYAGTAYQGIWKSVDSGSTWFRVDQPWSSDPAHTCDNLATGRTYLLTIDPRTGYLYAGNGYGCPQGIFRSVDGGVHWTTLADANTPNFPSPDPNNLDIDPARPGHFVVAFHSNHSTDTDIGVSETFDGGLTWTYHAPLPGWRWGHWVYFLTSTTWLLTMQDAANPPGVAGVYRTTDSGGHWTKVSDNPAMHGNASLYRSPTGALYLTTATGVIRSTDAGQSWNVAWSTGNSDGVHAVIGDGKNLYTRSANTGTATTGPLPYMTSPESDGTHWTALDAQTFTNGPMSMTIDSQTGLIYSSNWDAGLWRLQASPAGGGSAYHPVVPARLLDTRNGPGPLQAGESRSLRVTGTASVPATGITSVVLNVTAVNPTGASYLTLWPDAAPRPLASSLNWAAGQTVANLVTVSVANGSVDLFNFSGAVDVVVDVAGYYAAADTGVDGLYVPLNPARILDTRDQAAPLGGGTTRDLQVAGRAGVPADAEAVVLNLTVTNNDSSSYLTAWPKGVTMPLASNLNWPAGTTVPNRAIVKLGVGGTVSLYNFSGATDVVVDVGGYYTGPTSNGAGARFNALPPSRLLDTRITGGPLQAGESRPLAVAGASSVPSLAVRPAPRAVVLNVTVTDTTGGSYLTVYPTDLAAVPLISDLNWVPGTTIPNLVSVKLGADGSLDLYNRFGSADVVVDVGGWFG